MTVILELLFKNRKNGLLVEKALGCVLPCSAPKPSTLNLQPQILNPKPKPLTLGPKP
jgi:hypothetical protein